MDQWQVQIIVSVVTVAGSFVVAWFTAKHQMKKELFDRRYGVYRDVYEYLFKIRRDKQYRSEYQAVCDLYSLMIDVELCGSKNLISLIKDLYNDLDNSVKKVDELREHFSRQLQLQYDDICDRCGEFSSEADFFLNASSQRDEDPGEVYVLKDEDVDGRAIEIERELRRSLGYNEFRFAVWLRKTGFYGKFCPWV